MAEEWQIPVWSNADGAARVEHLTCQPQSIDTGNRQAAPDPA